MLIVLRLALREIRNHPRFAAFFAVNLALGFAGFVALDAFEISISEALEGRSRAFLGADVAVSSTRPLAAGELRQLDAVAGPGARVSLSIALFSMAGGDDRARLVELRAIDRNFPLYGRIELADGSTSTLDGDAAWIDPPLRTHLNTAVGDSIRIGHARFDVRGVVARDGGRPTSGFSIAPRVYIDIARLDATGLVATGSRIEYRRLYRLADGGDANATARAMRLTSEDPRIAVRSHEEATRDLARTYGAVSRYLGLVGLVAVFMAGIAAAHLFRAHLTRRVADVAILVSLGASRTRAQAVFLTQLVLLGLGAAGLAALGGALLLPAMASLAAELTPTGFAPRVGPRTVLAVAALATLGSATTCLPLVARLRRLQPSQLFAEQAHPSLTADTRDAWLWIPAGVGFWGLACWRVQSLLVGTLFTAGFGVAALVFVLAGIAALRILATIPPRRGLASRLALRELARGRARTLAGFVSLALCAMLVSLVPQMRGLLDRDLETPEAAQLPSFFLFDIQPDQREPLARHLVLRGTELQHISPLVRARLDSINGDAVSSAPTGEPPPARARAGRDGTAEAQQLRSRRYNLSYQPALTDSEILRAGRPFSGSWDPASNEPAELSLELDFAESLDVGLDDRLTFDVQGVRVEGRVVNLREVRWNSFRPNFFVTFQPGVLEEAPSVFLASVPHLPADRRDAIQASIAHAFPNISSIDVTRAVRRLLSLVDQLHWALGSTAWLSLVVGWLLVYALARDAARARRWETNLLKVLGADFPAIRRALDLEFALLGASAAVVGCGLSLAASAVLARWVFEIPWSAAVGPLLLVVLAVPAVCVASARAAARQVLREKPLVLLQAARA